MKKQFLLGLTAMLLPLTMWADGLTIKFADEVKKDGIATFEYAGTQTENKVKATITVSDGEKDLTESEYVLVFSQQNVGEMTVKAFGQGITYAGKDGQGNYTITPKVVTKLSMQENFSKTYGTADADVDLSQMISINNEDLAAGDEEKEKEDLIKGLALARIPGESDANEVGKTYQVIVVNKAGVTSNYTYEPGTARAGGAMTIAPKELTVSLGGDDATRVYNGEITKLEDLAELCSFGEDGAVEGEEVKVKLTNSRILKDVGSYSLAVDLDGADKGNYKLTTEKLGYKITKAELEIKAINQLSKIYGEDDPDFMEKDENGAYKYYNVTGLGSGDTFETLKVKLGRPEGFNNVSKATNGYTVWLYVNDSQVQTENYETILKNYSIKYDPNEEVNRFIINPKTVKYYFAGKTDTYTGAAETDLTKLYNVVVIEGEGEGFEDDHKLTVEPTAALELDGEAVEEGAVNVATYDLVEAEDSKFEVKAGTTDVTSNYTLEQAKASEVPAGGVAEEEKDFVNVNQYVIKQAEVTINLKEKEQNIDFGLIEDGKLPEDYQKKWLATGYMDIDMPEAIQGDARSADAKTIRTMLGIELQNGAQTGNSGEYKDGIVAFVKEDIAEDDEDAADAKNLILQNYDIKIGTAATLTINSVGSLTFDASKELLAETLKEYDGATVTTVKVMNLKSVAKQEIRDTIYADMWYTLVLPFDITVKDLSSKLGYAVVNVPNEANSDADVAKFKLTVGTVPANTLMAFKIDNKRKATNLSFTNRTIVAPADGKSVITDDAGNSFVGVYDLYETAADDEWVMWTNGRFVNVATGAATRNDEGNVLKIYPFNGYVQTASAKARILMEEADGSTTAINAVTGEVIGNSAEGWYTVGGVKLNAMPTQKGIYISNGKKVVIK